MPSRPFGARPPATSGLCSWHAFTSLRRSPVRATSQTTYGAHQRPTTLRITYPPHPLVGQSCNVVGHRREGGRTYWVIELVDGSRLRVPSFWTDHPVGGDPQPALRLGGRATPQALHNLARLIQHLALCAAPGDAQLHSDTIGDADARATQPIRYSGAQMGTAATPASGPPDTRSPHRHPEGHGTSGAAPANDRRPGGGSE